MDMQTLDMEIFLRSLTEDQMNTCESDEKKLAEIFAKGWSIKTAVRFHRAMLCARRLTPDATVDGVFELALHIGLSALCDERLTTPKAPTRKGKPGGVGRGVRGVRVVGVPGNRHGSRGVSIKDA